MSKKNEKPQNYLSVFVYEVGVYDGVPMAKVKDDPYSKNGRYCIVMSLGDLRKVAAYLYKQVEILAEYVDSDKCSFIGFYKEEA